MLHGAAHGSRRSRAPDDNYDYDDATHECEDDDDDDCFGWDGVGVVVLDYIFDDCVYYISIYNSMISLVHILSLLFLNGQRSLLFRQVL